MRLIFIAILCPLIAFNQSLSRPLLKSNSILFRNSIYVYGFAQDKNDLQFKLYKTAVDLIKIDSVSNSIGKEKPERFLEITADTLHGYLNFYLQKENNKSLVTLLRYSDSLRLITKVDDFESSKINSLTTFENEIYNYKNTTYTIRTSEDSLGKQFYLTKYRLITDQKPFEYKQVWQYPLEKRNINTTHVFYADSETVFIYVTILSGDRKGQWILKLDAQKGTLIKGIKLNANGDDRNYILSAHQYDSKEKELIVGGNIYTKQQLDIETKNFSFNGLNKENTFFFVKIDANNEVISRDQKTFSVSVVAPAIKTSGKPAPPPFYHIRIKELKKISKTDYQLYCDIYKSSPGSLLFLYLTGFSVDLVLEEMGIELIPGKIYTNTLPFPNLVNTDPKDINGKIELKSIAEFDKFLYKCPVAEIEKCSGKDDLKNQKWIICKSDIKTGVNSFYQVFIGQKGVESKLLLQASKYNHPNIAKINDQKLFKFNSNSESGIFELNVLNW